MKFLRHIKADNRREITPRRLAAARRALQKQADAVALFPELQPKQTPQERCEVIDLEGVAYWQRIRNHTAETWKQARRDLRALTPEQRAQVLARWHCPNWHPPHEAHYLADLIFCAKRETLTPRL